MPKLFRVGPSIGYRAERLAVARLFYIRHGGLLALFLPWMYFADPVGFRYVLAVVTACAFGYLLVPRAHSHTLYAQRRWIGYVFAVMYVLAIGIACMFAWLARADPSWSWIAEIYTYMIIFATVLSLVFIEFMAEESLIPPTYDP